MMASEVRCPVCGAGLADVAPDQDLSTGRNALWDVPERFYFCHCTSGHALTLQSNTGGVRAMTQAEGAKVLEAKALEGT